MSAGELLATGYEDDDLRVFPIQVHPSTVTLSIQGRNNSEPFRNIDQSISVSVRTTRRTPGIVCRRTVIAFTGTVPPGYTGAPIEVVWLRRDRYRDITVGGTGTWNGFPVIVVAKHGESAS